MAKQIFFDNEGREQLNRGIRKLSDAVRVTLGPTAITMMQVSTINIALPYFHASTGYRVTGLVQNPSGQHDHFPTRLFYTAPDFYQVVIDIIESHSLNGVKRPLGG